MLYGRFWGIPGTDYFSDGEEVSGAPPTPMPSCLPISMSTPVPMPMPSPTPTPRYSRLRPRPPARPSLSVLLSLTSSPRYHDSSCPPPLLLADTVTISIIPLRSHLSYPRRFTLFFTSTLPHPLAATLIYDPTTTQKFAAPAQTCRCLDPITGTIGTTGSGRE